MADNFTQAEDLQSQIDSINKAKEQYQKLLAVPQPKATEDALRLSIGKLNKNRERLEAQQKQLVPDVQTPIETPEQAVTETYAPQIDHMGRIINAPGMKAPEVVQQEVQSNTIKAPEESSRVSYIKKLPPIKPPEEPEMPGPVDLPKGPGSTFESPITTGTTAKPINLGMGNTTFDTELKGFDKRQDAITQQMTQAENIAKIQQNFYKQQEKILEDNRKQQDSFNRRREEEFNNYQKSISGAMDDYRNEKIDSNRMWANKSTGQRILGMLASALGAYAATYTGKENVATKIIDKAIERDIDEQRANIDKKRNEIKDQYTLYGMAQKRYADEESRILFAKSTAIEKIQNELDNKMAGVKSEVAKNRLLDLSGQLENQKAEYVNELVDRQMTLEAGVKKEKIKAAADITKQMGKQQKFSENETKSAAFAGRMVRAEKDLESAMKGTDPAGIISGGFQGMLPNFLKGDARQRYEQAKLNWVTANLRKESGAAMPESELQTEYKKYFPQPGDSAAVIEQKRKTRKIAEQGMIKSAGAAYTPQNNQSGQQPSSFRR